MNLEGEARSVSSYPVSKHRPISLPLKFQPFPMMTGSPEAGRPGKSMSPPAIRSQSGSSSTNAVNSWHDVLITDSVCERVSAGSSSPEGKRYPQVAGHSCSGLIYVETGGTVGLVGPAGEERNALCWWRRYCSPNSLLENEGFWLRLLSGVKWFRRYVNLHPRPEQ
jgi:hypothetical protein